ncbi:MAG: RloB domain-containing protein [Alphaproteobacteria bacterium]|nr:RloB domain-containing protein [Alphaproteobacteria bacterium]
MANDKFHNKRKAKEKADFKRKEASLEVPKRVLIICEDSVSAPNYFERLFKHFDLTTAEIIVCGGECDSAPSSVVKYGEDYLEQDDDFEYVFFVFDRDTHETYDSALAKIAGLNKKREYKLTSIQAITSNPCFELWLKLHFDGSTKPYHEGKKSPANSLIDDLKKIKAFKDYSKDSKCIYFDDIKDHIDTAIKNAKSLIQDGIGTGGDKHHANPSTLIHELIVVLRDEIKT